MIHYLLPMVGFIVAYITAKVFKQTPDKCIAIAVESTILNFCNMFYFIILFIL